MEYTLQKPDYHSWWSSKTQSGHEDTLEEQRYAIKFCFKLERNATEMYGMLQTAFGASCMNRASVFEWYKRFKEGRESVRETNLMILIYKKCSWCNGYCYREWTWWLEFKFYLHFLLNIWIQSFSLLCKLGFLTLVWQPV